MQNLGTKSVKLKLVLNLFLSVTCSLAFADDAVPVKPSAPRFVTCQSMSRIIRFAAERHPRHLELDVISAEFAGQVAERFTNDLIENYSLLLIEQDVVELKRVLADFDKQKLADGLVGGDCRFFESSTAVLERAYWRFKSNFYRSFYAMVELLVAMQPKSEGQTAEKVAQDFNVLRMNRMQEIANLISNDPAVVSGEFTKKQAAQNTLYQLNNSLNAFRLELRHFAYDRAVKAFSAVLDPHSNYLSPLDDDEYLSEYEPQYGVGISLKMVPFGVRVGQLFDGGAAKSSKQINEGDIIFAVNGRSILGVTVAEVSSWIKGPKGTSVVLQVGSAKNGGMRNTRDITIVRDELKISQTKLSHSRTVVDDKSILTLHFEDFYYGVAEDLRMVLWSEQKKAPVDAVVIDLRYNPGGLVSEAVLIASLFLERGPVVMTESLTKNEIYDVVPRVIQYRGPLLLVVNNGSASASEILAGALHDYQRAIIVGGQHTLGKGNFQSVYTPDSTDNKLPAGVLMLTGGLYYTASGMSPQFEGISSDIVIPGPSLDVAYEESHRPGALKNDSLDRVLYGYLEKKANRDGFLKEALPRLKSDSAMRLSADTRFTKANPSNEDQLNEVYAIAAQYASIVQSQSGGKRCVMKTCESQ